MWYLTADLHAANREANATVLKDGTNSRLQHVLDFMRGLGKIANKEKDTLFVIGDVFHDRRSVPHTVIERVVSLFKQLQGGFRQVIVVQGNHDETDTGDGSTALTAIAPYCMLIRPPGEVVTVDGCAVNLVPYTTDEEDAVKWCHRKADYLMAHLGILGGKIGPSSYEVPGKVKVKALHLERYRMAFFGHYHKHQHIAENAVYIGSPMQHDWGESGEEKGHIQLLPKKGAWKLIRNRESPRFVALKVTDVLDDEARPQDFVRLIAEPDQQEAAEDKASTAQSLLGFESISVHVLPAESKGPRLDVAGKSDKDMLKAYVEAHPPGEEVGEMKPKDFIDVGIGILEKARAM